MVQVLQGRECGEQIKEDEAKVNYLGCFDLSQGDNFGMCVPWSGAESFSTSRGSYDVVSPCSISSRCVLPLSLSFDAVVKEKTFVELKHTHRVPDVFFSSV